MFKGEWCEGGIMMLIKNEKFEINAENDNVFLKVHRANIEMSEFNKSCTKHPRIKITKFANIKLALETVKTTLAEIYIQIGGRSQVIVDAIKDLMTEYSTKLSKN